MTAGWRVIATSSLPPPGGSGVALALALRGKAPVALPYSLIVKRLTDSRFHPGEDTPPPPPPPPPEGSVVALAVALRGRAPGVALPYSLIFNRDSSLTI
jgi:hypothetical protein